MPGKGLWNPKGEAFSWEASPLEAVLGDEEWSEPGLLEKMEGRGIVPATGEGEPFEIDEERGRPRGGLMERDGGGRAETESDSLSTIVVGMGGGREERRVVGGEGMAGAAGR